MHFKPSRLRHVPLTCILIVSLQSYGCKYDGPPGTATTSGGTDTGGFPLDDCLDYEDCADPWKPVCDEGVCVPCASSGDCPDMNYPTCIGGACAVSCTSDDAKEPNDNSMDAKTVINGSDFNLTLCQQAGTYHDTEDWFKFTVASASYISVITNNNAHDGDFDLTVYNDNNMKVDSTSNLFYGAHVPRSVEAIHARVVADTYYIRIRATDGAGSIPYRLVVRILTEG